MDARPPAVELRGLTKAYRLYDAPIQRLKEALHPWGRSFHRDFYALHGVDLTVAAGRTVGLIGLNGSGKSTLLKVVCGVTRPTSGQVTVRGRVAALLELGAGFNPEFTGRQNVFFAGALAGFSRREMHTRLPEIVAFADIGEYLDQPVKSYSSGMLMRLAFAVASHVDPDILVVDEALSVGDAPFQHKCLTRIQSFKGRSTILFVTHDMTAVTAFCDEAVWLHQGRVLLAGDPQEVVRRYVEASYEGVDEAGGRSESRTEGFGLGRAAIEAVELSVDDQAGAETVSHGQSVRLRLTVAAKEALAAPLVGFFVSNRVGLHLLECNSQLLGAPLAPMAAGQRRTLTFAFTWPKLRSGSYAFTVAVAEGTIASHQQEHLIFDAQVVECLEPEAFNGLVGLPDIRLQVE